MDTKEGSTWLLVMQARNFIVLIENKTSSEIHESTNAFCVSLPFVAHRIIPMKKLLDFVILLLTTTTVTAYIKRAPGEIRTPDLLVRSQPLYPTELRARLKNQ